MKIIHAADLHLDSPLQGLSRYEGAPVERLRGATRHAFERIIELCLEHGAEALLLAGDNFDSDWRDYRTGLFFLSQLNRLREVGTRVLLIRGNHDSRNEVTRSLSWPDHVHEFDSRKAETILIADGGVAVHGISYTQREVTESLLSRYPEPERASLNIGLLHTNVDGAKVHDNYAPCKLHELTEKGYDYWALGHVHEHRVLSDAPHVVYSGCPQGRHVRETGAKGCVLIKADGHGVRSVELVETDVIRWAHLTVSPEPDTDSVDALLAQCSRAIEDASDGLDRFLAVRVELSGAFAAVADLAARREQFEAELRSSASHAGRDVWVEKVVVRLRPPSSSLPDEGLIAAVRRRVAALYGAPDDALPTQCLVDLQSRAGAELRQAGLDLDDPEALRALLPQVEAVLLARLGAEGLGS